MSPEEGRNEGGAVASRRKKGGARRVQGGVGGAVAVARRVAVDNSLNVLNSVNVIVAARASLRRNRPARAGETVHVRPSKSGGALRVVKWKCTNRGKAADTSQRDWIRGITAGLTEGGEA